MSPRDFASGRNPCGGKKCLGLWIKFNGLNERRCYVLAYVIIIVNVVPCIVWHYINVDEVRWITLKKIITKCDGIITNCDSLVYYKARWTLQIATAFLLQSATRFITNCDRYYKVRWIYYKFRQVLQSAMIITNCDSTPPPYLRVWITNFLILFKKNKRWTRENHYLLT